jgi:ComF family protein
MQGVFRELIHRFKYRNLRAATPVLGQLLGDYLPSHPMPGQIIVPVPLYRRRLHSRGYNQATLLAQELSKLTNLPVDSVVLARRQDALPQAETSCRQQRPDNVRGNFEWNSGVSGLEVLLIDDVSTTGSTLSECAAVLKDAGAVSVWGLALAKEA